MFGVIFGRLRRGALGESVVKRKGLRGYCLQILSGVLRSGVF
jgi:hypothetical protein